VGGKNEDDCLDCLVEASAALCVICGRMSLANCRTTARVPSCNFFCAGVKSGSILYCKDFPNQNDEEENSKLELESMKTMKKLGECQSRSIECMNRIKK
jgi:hypothetical protein